MNKLCMNFIELACNIFLSFVPLRTIFISSAKAVQNFFLVFAHSTPTPQK